MEALLLVVHVACSIGLVVVILLQSGKGGGLGSGFGGAGAAATQIFGGRGAGNFLSRTTVGLAAVFMATSLTLAYLSSQPRSLMDLNADGGAGGTAEDEIIEQGSGAPTGDAPAPAIEVNPADDVPAPGAESGDDADSEAFGEGGLGLEGAAEEAVEEEAAEEPAPEAAEKKEAAPAPEPAAKEEAAPAEGRGGGSSAGAGAAGAPTGGDSAKPEEEVLPGANDTEAPTEAE